MRTAGTLLKTMLGALALTLFATTGPLTAQTHWDDETAVVVVNESLHELKIYAFDDDVDDRRLIGWVGSNEVEMMDVPERITEADGWYRIAVQEALPQPQLGVPATAELYSTPVLSPEPGETIRLFIDEDMEMSDVVVR